MLSMSALQAELDTSPMNRFLGIQVEAVDAAAQTARFGMAIRPELARLDGSDQAHGGAIASLIDIAGDFAIAAVLGGPVPTIHLTVEFLRPAGGGRLVAGAKVRKLGRTIVVVDVEVADGAGRLVALGRGSYSGAVG